MSDMVVTADEMSVVDVYDLASDIGKECEKIIDLFGADSLLKLMPKVINVLELLETIATRNESENTRLQELNDRIAHLECEKQEKAVFRQRFDKAALSSSDIAEPLAVYQKTSDDIFGTVQNNLNVQRQAFNQAFSKLSENIKQSCDAKVRLTEDHLQNECNRQVYELNHQLKELTNRSNSEKMRLQAELQTQTRNADVRMDEMIKNHQNELARVRSELTAASTQSLTNLRQQLENQISVAQAEVLRIQSEHESDLRNIQGELEQTRKYGETRFRNAQMEIEQQSRKIQQIL